MRHNLSAYDDLAARICPDCMNSMNECACEHWHADEPEFPDGEFPNGARYDGREAYDPEPTRYLDDGEPDYTPDNR
jgi:hypothetical protein